jgi:IMP cyclohydrolase
MVSPLDPADLAKNPYIAYNCIRTVEKTAVVANGTHADMIHDHISDGCKPLDAVGLSLLAHGYERDELNTPRIAGVVSGPWACLGIAMRDGFSVKSFHLEDGDAYMVATYEKTDFEMVSLGADNAPAIVRAAYGLPFEKPVCAAAALSTENGYDLAVYNPRMR